MTQQPRRRGRPEVGGLARVRLGDLLAEVDRHAETEGVTRSEMVRRLVAEALTQRRDDQIR